MKKMNFRLWNLFAIAILSTLLISVTSCSEEYAPSITLPENPCAKSYPPYNSILADSSFWAALDSLSNAQITQKYQEKKTTIIKTGTRVGEGGTLTKNEYEEIKSKNLIGGKIADQLGAIAGRYGGRWIGGAIVKDPGAKRIEKTIGQKVGQLAGGILASALTNVFIPLNEKSGSIQPGQRPDDSIIGSWGNNIAPGLTPSSPKNMEDSIGYIHNKIMNKLISNRKRYENNGNINSQQMYIDCISYLQQEGFFNDTIAYDTEYRKNIINFAVQTANNSLSCYQGITSGKDVLNKGISLLQQEYNISEEEAQELKQLSMTVTETASEMSFTQAQDYINKNKKIIENSNLTNEKKQDVEAFINLTINSSIYWDALQQNTYK